MLAFFAASCGPDEEPVACFTTEGTEFKTYDPIAFKNCSKNSVSHSYHLGDGTIIWEDEPTHMYTKPGKYNVTMIAASNKSSDTTLVKLNILDNTEITGDDFDLEFMSGDSQTFNCAPSLPLQFRIKDNYHNNYFKPDWIASESEENLIELKQGDWGFFLYGRIGALQYLEKNSATSSSCEHCYNFSWHVPNCQDFVSFFNIELSITFKGEEIQGSPKLITGFLPG